MPGEPEDQVAEAELYYEVSAAAREFFTAVEAHRVAVEAAQVTATALADAKARRDAAFAAAATVPDKA